MRKERDKLIHTVIFLVSLSLFNITNQTGSTNDYNEKHLENERVTQKGGSERETQTVSEIERQGRLY